jgi:hypothetical protein
MPHLCLLDVKLWSFYCCSCATGINLAFEGVDANSAAFTTASQVKKLTSYSLVSVYFKAKEAFLDTVSSRQAQLAAMCSLLLGTCLGRPGAI